MVHAAASDAASSGRAAPAAPTLAKVGRGWPILAALAVAAAFVSPTGLFTVDEFFYLQMAAAFAGDGGLSFVQMRLDGVDAVDMVFASPSDGEPHRLVPQYPSGYAVVAGPFYAAFGERGLLLLNAVASVFAAWATHRIARRVYGDADVAVAAACLFAFASIAPTYAHTIWPHMLALAPALWAIALLLDALVPNALVLNASGADGRGARMRPAAAAGLLLGLTVSLRVDAALAMVAGVVWLRAFVCADRRLALAFLVGSAPGLAFAAALNFVKFGVFLPISYGRVEGVAALSTYAPLFLGVGTTLVAALALDLKALRQRIASHTASHTASHIASPGRRRVLLGAGAVAAVVAVAAGERVAALAHGFYALLIDLQVHPHEVGGCPVTADASGVYAFCGLYKRALTQSMPFLGLAALSLWRFFRGRGGEGEGLLWLVAGAYVAFYAIDAWHGGLAVNMRYLLPTAALMCALCAKPLVDLGRAAGASVLGPLVAFFAGYAVKIAGSFLAATPYAGVAQLYPYSAAFALAAAAAVAYAAKDTAFRARAAFLCALAAVGAGVGAAGGDLVFERGQRAETLARETQMSAAVARGSLVLADDPAWFARRAAADVSLVYGSFLSEDEIAAIATPFAAAGRCVFVHGDLSHGRVAAAGLVAAPVAEYARGERAWTLSRVDVPSADGSSGPCAQ